MSNMNEAIQSDICEITSPHEDVISSVLQALPTDEETSAVADIFKVLSDITRLKIVLALMEHELCVCDICEIVGYSQSAVSHQLRILRNTHLAKFRREGKQVYYSIDDNHVGSIISQALDHIKHNH